MLKKTIVYVDFDGVERKEDHYFNLTKSELVEMEVGVMPDEYGNGLYETLVTEGNQATTNQWMTAFDPEMVQVASA